MSWKIRTVDIEIEIKSSTYVAECSGVMHCAKKMVLIL